MNAADDLAREHRRQQGLLRVLWREGAAEELRPLLATPPEAVERGLQAYRANAGAAAERALNVAYPTVAALLGAESFAALARACWQAQPPERGDLAQFGAGLPAFIADSEPLVSERYLADCARLDWAVHEATMAADAGPGAQGLERLGDADALSLRFVFRPGTRLLSSPHPVVSIWQAHQGDAAEGGDRFAQVRAARAAGRGEHALVWRVGWRVSVRALSPADARFTAALLAGAALGAALDACVDAADFSFEAWLIAALQQGWVVGVAPA